MTPNRSSSISSHHRNSFHSLHSSYLWHQLSVCPCVSSSTFLSPHYSHLHVTATRARAQPCSLIYLCDTELGLLHICWISQYKFIHKHTMQLQKMEGLHIPIWNKLWSTLISKKKQRWGNLLLNTVLSNLLKLSFVLLKFFLKLTDYIDN